MSRPKSTVADGFGRHLQMKDRLIEVTSLVCIEFYSLRYYPLILDEFNDTLVRMLFLVSVISSALTGYDGDKGGGKRFNEFKGSLSTFIGVLCALIWMISLKYFQENSKVFVKYVAGLENRNTLHKAPNGLVWQRVNTDFAYNLEINEGGEKKLNDFGEFLTAIIGVLYAVIWLMNVKYFLFWEFVNGGHRNFEKYTYYFQIAVAWAAIPEGLLVVDLAYQMNI